MSLRSTGLALLSYLVFFAAVQAAPPTPLIKIDASTLTPGPAASIANAGSQGGTFNALGIQTPYVETVAGKKAITFNGSNGYRASFNADASVTSMSAWSVATWIYNPTVGSDEKYFQWARRFITGDTGGGGGQALLAYCTDAGWGAVDHYSNYNMAWGRLGGAPAAGVWHHICLTFDGCPATGTPPWVGPGTGTEKIYVDGVLVTVNTLKPLNLIPGTQVLLGLEQRSINAAAHPTEAAQWGKNGLSGSIASLNMYNVELSSDDVVALAGGQNLVVPAGTPLLANPSFEDYIWSGRNRGDRTPGGNSWAAFSRQTGSVMNMHLDHFKGGQIMNSGLLVDGGTVLGLEVFTPASLYANQPLWGTKPNTTYKVWGYFCQRYLNSNTGYLQIKVDGVDLFPAPIQLKPIDANGTYATPYQRIETTFTTNANVNANHFLSLGNVGPANTATNTNEVLCDKIQVAEVGGPARPVLSTTTDYTPKSMDFFGVQKGSSVTKSVNLVNDGGSDLTVTGVATIGTDGFNYTPSFSASTVTAFGGSVPISVTFAPTSDGTFNNSQLKIDTSAGTLYLPLAGYTLAKVANGSFEQIAVNTGGGDWQPSYPGWDLSSNVAGGQIGFGQAGQARLDNGKFSDGNQAAWLSRDTKDNTTATLSQNIPGFIGGHTYRFRFFLNSWKGTTSVDGQAWADVKLNGQTMKGVKRTGSVTATMDFPTTITNREASGTRNTVYDQFTYDWTAPANGTAKLEFGHVGNAGGDGRNGLLIDNVGIFDMAAPGVPTISATRLDWGYRQINTSSTMSLTFSNLNGSNAYTVSGATFSGPSAGEFNLATATPVTVPAFGTATVSIRLAATAFGQKDSTVTLATSVPGVSFAVGLTGFVPLQPQLRNGSLEEAILGNPSADNQNSAPTGWAWSTPNTSQVGRSWAGAMYNNNGLNPAGGAAAWMRKGAADTTRTLYQDVYGFRAGRTYRISFYANPSATNGTVLPVSGKAGLKVRLGVTDITSVTLSAVDPSGTFTTSWQKFTVDFTATNVEAYGAVRLNINLMPSGTDDALLVDGVSIQEVAPLLQASPATVRFNTVNWYKNDKPSTVTITLTNNGIQALNFTGGGTGTPGLAIIDTQFATGGPAFSIVSTTPASKASLAVGESMTVQVKFNPTKRGNYTALGTLRVTSNDPNFSPLDIPLTGDAVPVELSTFSVE